MLIFGYVSAVSIAGTKQVLDIKILNNFLLQGIAHLKLQSYSFPFIPFLHNSL